MINIEKIIVYKLFKNDFIFKQFIYKINLPEEKKKDISKLFLDSKQKNISFFTMEYNYCLFIQLKDNHVGFVHTTDYVEESQVMYLFEHLIV